MNGNAMPRTTWQKHLNALKPKPLGIKSQANLPNGGKYTICEPGIAEGSCLMIRWFREKRNVADMGEALDISLQT